MIASKDGSCGTSTQNTYTDPSVPIKSSGRSLRRLLDVQEIKSRIVAACLTSAEESRGKKAGTLAWIVFWLSNSSSIPPLFPRKDQRADDYWVRTVLAECLSVRG